MSVAAQAAKTKGIPNSDLTEPRQRGALAISGRVQKQSLHRTLSTTQDSPARLPSVLVWARSALHPIICVLSSPYPKPASEEPVEALQALVHQKPALLTPRTLDLPGGP